MYSNICEKTKCSFNNYTGYCKKIKKANIKESYQCFCNLRSGRCIKKKKLNEKAYNIISEKKKIKIDNITITSIGKRRCTLDGFGKTYLSIVKDCFPLPKSSGLIYGILKRPIDNIENKCIVYDQNYKYYNIKYENNNLIINLMDYKILIQSSKNCKLLNI